MDLGFQGDVEVAVLLKDAKEEKARIKAEGIIRQGNNIEVH